MENTVWKEKLANDYPRFDLSTHEGDSFQETYRLISDPNLVEFIQLDRVDLLQYYRDMGDQNGPTMHGRALKQSSPRVSSGCSGGAV